MNSIEEKLWNYIDGNCTPAEQQAIALLIEKDDNCRRKYNELLGLNAQFAAMELEEPPMAFTYKVMEQIRAEQALKPLKATVDKRIIKAIAWFFILSITILVIFALSQVDWSANATSWKIPKIALPAFKLPALSNLASGPIVQGFLFFDLVLGLYLFDYWLRKKKAVKTA